MTDTPKICKHGSLRRHCEICDLAEDVDALQAELALLKEAVLDAEKIIPRSEPLNRPCPYCEWMNRHAAAIDIAGKP
mgnify:FL=1